MAGSNDIHKVRRRPKFQDGELEDGKVHKSRSSRHEGEAVEPDISEVRRIRLEKLEGHSTKRTARNSAATEEMPTESSATVDATKSTSSHRRRRRHHASEDDAGHHLRSKTSGREERSRSDYVYASPRDSDSRHNTRGITITETRRRDEDDESSSDSEDEHKSKLEPMDKSKKKKIKVVVREQPKRSSSTSRVKKEDKDKAPTKRSADGGTSVSKSTSHRTKISGGDSVSRPPLSRHVLRPYTFHTLA